MSKVLGKDSYSRKFIKAQKVKEHRKGREGKGRERKRGEGRGEGREQNEREGEK